jgi:hypothetical protein
LYRKVKQRLVLLHESAYCQKIARISKEKPMVRFDNLFGKKPAPKTEPVELLAESADKASKEQSPERRSQRLERRELLYAVVRESMARVGLLSTSYKYKVLSLDSRGQQFLIMMDLPLEMAGQLNQLLEIETTIQANARTRHHIEVASVYWRISESGKPNSAILRKPRTSSEADAQAQGQARFDPISSSEMEAFKSGAKVSGAVAKPAQDTLSRNGIANVDFAETRLEDEETRMPLSRTQYGDLI